MLKFTTFNEEFDVEKIRKFVKPTERKTVKDDLNPVVWDKKKMRPEIRERLLAIAEDFHESLELEVPLENVVLVGSMANFNWHRHSDFDLHLIVDFKKINDDVKLVEELLDLSKKRWNELHHIYIKKI